MSEQLRRRGWIGAGGAASPSANVARGICIDDLRIELAGNIDLPVFFGLKEGHAGYRGIDVKVLLRTDADKVAIAELHDTVLRTSPVGHTLERPAALRVELMAA